MPEGLQSGHPSRVRESLHHNRHHNSGAVRMRMAQDLEGGDPAFRAIREAAGISNRDAQIVRYSCPNHNSEWHDAHLLKERRRHIKVRMLCRAEWRGPLP